MKVRNLLILLLVVVLIFACTYVVMFGLSFGVKEVGFLYLALGSGDVIGKLTVVGYYQKSFSVLIKSADGKKPLSFLIGKIIHYGFVPLVRAGSYAPARFIEHIISHFSSPFFIECELENLSNSPFLRLFVNINLLLRYIPFKEEHSHRIKYCQNRNAYVSKNCKPHSC